MFYFIGIFALFIIGVIKADAGLLIASALVSIALEIAVSNEGRKKK